MTKRVLVSSLLQRQIGAAYTPPSLLRPEQVRKPQPRVLRGLSRETRDNLEAVPAFFKDEEKGWIPASARMMEKNANVAGILFLLAFLILSSALHAEDNAPSGTELAQKVHDYHIGNNSVSKVTMQLVDHGGSTRERSLMSMTMEKNNLRKTMIRFLEPADIAGTGFLSVEQDDGDTQQFLYLPALDRTRRIVTAHKGRAFVNTDFSYEDMERRPVDDAEYEIVGQEKINGLECWILVVRPLPKADSQYSSLKTWVPKHIALPIKTLFFDQQQKHIKTYKVPELQEVQGIWTPMQQVMIDHEEGHTTVLTTQDIEYNSSQVDDSFFTTRYLESW